MKKESNVIKKREYEAPGMEVIQFESNEVILKTSGEDDDIIWDEDNND